MVKIFNIYLSIIVFCIALYLIFKGKETSKKKYITLSILSFIFFTMTNTFIVSNYFTGVGLNDAVLYHLSLETVDAGLGEYLNIILASTAIFLTSLLASYKIITKKRSSKVGTILLSIAILISPLTYNIYRLVKPNDFKVKDLDLTNHSNSKVKITNKKNIIIVYAEGFERSYMKENLFPGMTPHMRELEKNSISFPNMHSVYGATWTIAGIVSSQCGVPLVAAGEQNSMVGVENFYPSATCLPDILSSNGYVNTHIQGSSAHFSGTKNYLHTHNFHLIKGLTELKKEYPTNRTSSWGFYDKNIFDDAKKVADGLSKEGHPFFLTISTMDTHHPRGHVFPSCKIGTDEDNRLEKAFKCSDFYITEFVKSIRNSEYSKDTIIVVMSDHISMRNILHDRLKGETRKNLFLINFHNNEQAKVINKEGSHLDIASTLLSLLGSNDNIGLGKSLFSNEKTIVETYKEETNSYLRSQNKNFLKLWSLPITDEKLVLKDDELYIGKNKFKYPIIIKYQDDGNIIPYYDGNKGRLLRELTRLKDNQKFSLVDSCSVIRALFSMNFKKNGTCILTGTLNGEVSIQGTDYKQSSRDRKFQYLRKAKQKREGLVIINGKLYESKLVVDYTPTKTVIHNAIKKLWYKVIDKEFYPKLTGIKVLKFVKELKTDSSI